MFHSQMKLLEAAYDQSQCLTHQSALCIIVLICLSCLVFQQMKKKLSCFVRIMTFARGVRITDIHQRDPIINMIDGCDETVMAGCTLLMNFGLLSLNVCGNTTRSQEEGQGDSHSNFPAVNSLSVSLQISLQHLNKVKNNAIFLLFSSHCSMT